MSSSGKEVSARRLSFLIAFVMGGIALGAGAVENNLAHTARFSSFANAPLYFESNAGQVAGGAQYVARGTECSVLLAPTEAEILLGKASDAAAANGIRAVRLQLLGANPASEITGRDPLSAKANYFIGSQSSEWHMGIPLFSRVQVDEAYPGVQVIYYANQAAQLEYDFLLQPGARADQIRLRIDGADTVRVDTAGNLVLKIGDQEIRQHKPVAYQKNAGARTEVEAGYHLNADGTVGFTLAHYDRSLALTIDPVLDFLTYIGGRKNELGWAIALDPTTKNIYVAGETLSTDLPTSNTVTIQFTNGVSTGTNFAKFRGGNNAFGDAFVAKYDDSGALQFLTYLGGKRDDGALGIAFDTNAMAVWVTGFTDSTNFPLVNPDPNRTQLDGPNKNANHIPPVDAFIAKIDSGGSNLLFSTYFGGSSIDEGIGIAVSPGGDVFVTGLTSSTNLHVVPTNAFQTQLAGAFDGFITRLSGANNIYTNVYTTYLGGTNIDYAVSIALDSKTDAWLTGVTYSTNFYTTNALQLSAGVNPFYPDGLTMTNLNTETNQPKHTILNPRSDAFITELDPTGTMVPFSTFLGGSNNDVGEAITIDASDNVYVTGYTLAVDFPTNQIVVTPTNGVAEVPNETAIVFPNPGTNFFAHVFVAKIANQALADSVEFGGNLSDQGRGIAVDANGLIYVTGSLSSTNFFQRPLLVTNSIPTKRGIRYFGVTTNSPVFTDLSSTNAVRLRRGGNTNNIFVVVLNSDMSAFDQTISLGGVGRDEANQIAVDPSGSAVYIVGTTTSPTNFATTNAAQPLFGGTGRNSRLSDAFVGKIQLLP